MKKTVKPLGLITILLLCFSLSNAQLKLPVVNGIGNDMKKVIAEYPSQFTALMGNEVASSPQSTEYECNFKVNGAEESSITKYAASKKMVCSWQALMLTTESFEKAKQKYKSLFSQVNNLEVNINGKKYKLHGKYDTPSNERKFFSSVFKAASADNAVKKMKAEVQLIFNEPAEWKITVLVYEQEKEDEEE